MHTKHKHRYVLLIYGLLALSTVSTCWALDADDLWKPIKSIEFDDGFSGVAEQPKYLPDSQRLPASDDWADSVSEQAPKISQQPQVSNEWVAPQDEWGVIRSPQQIKLQKRHLKKVVRGASKKKSLIAKADDYARAYVEYKVLLKRLENEPVSQNEHDSELEGLRSQIRALSSKELRKYVAELKGKSRAAKRALDDAEHGKKVLDKKVVALKNEVERQKDLERKRQEKQEMQREKEREAERKRYERQERLERERVAREQARIEKMAAVERKKREREQAQERKREQKRAQKAEKERLAQVKHEQEMRLRQQRIQEKELREREKLQQLQAKREQERARRIEEHKRKELKRIQEQKRKQEYHARQEQLKAAREHDEREKQMVRAQEKERKRQEALARKAQEQHRKAIKRAQEKQRKQEELARKEQIKAEKERIAREKNIAREQEKERKRQEALARKAQEQQRKAIKRAQEKQRKQEELARKEQIKAEKERIAREKNIAREQEKERKRQEALARKAQEQQHKAIKRAQEKQLKQEEQERKERMKAEKDRIAREKNIAREQEKERKRQEALARKAQEQQRKAIKRAQQQQRKQEERERKERMKAEKDRIAREKNIAREQEKERKRQEALARKAQEQQRKAIKRAQEEQRKQEELARKEQIKAEKERIAREKNIAREQKKERKRQEALARKAQEQQRKAIKRAQEEQRKQEERERKERMKAEEERIAREKKIAQEHERARRQQEKRARDDQRRHEVEVLRAQREQRKEQERVKRMQELERIRQEKAARKARREALKEQRREELNRIKAEKERIRLEQLAVIEAEKTRRKVEQEKLRIEKERARQIRLEQAEARREQKRIEKERRQARAMIEKEERARQKEHKRQLARQKKREEIQRKAERKREQQEQRELEKVRKLRERAQINHEKELLREEKRKQKRSAILAKIALKRKILEQKRKEKEEYLARKMAQKSKLRALREEQINTKPEAKALKISRLLYGNDNMMVKDIHLASKVLHDSLEASALDEQDSYLSYLINSLMRFSKRVDHWWETFGSASSVFAGKKKHGSQLEEVIGMVASNKDIRINTLLEARKKIRDDAVISPRDRNDKYLLDASHSLLELTTAVRKWRQTFRYIHQMMKEEHADRSIPALSKKKSKIKLAKRRNKRRVYYKLPTWPFGASFSEDKHLIKGSVSYRWAQDAFSSSGNKHDLSFLPFKEKCLQIQDILLASKLVHNETLVLRNPPTVALPNTDYLDFLAETKLRAHAEQEEWTVSFDYMRYVRSNDIAVGIHLPLVHKHHDLCINEQLPSSGNIADKLTSGTTGSFREKYGGSFDRFLDDILTRKGLRIETSNSEFGLGNMDLFLNVQFHSTNFERLVTGFEVQLPTAKRLDTSVVWGPHLGNESYTQVKLFASVLYAHNNYFNPHFFGRVLYNIPYNVHRRLARIKSFDGNLTNVTTAKDGTRIDDFLLFGDQLHFVQDKSFSEPESCIPAFANSATKVNIHGGFEFHARVGNVFQRFLNKQLYFDIFYDLRLKEKDSVGGNLSCDEWDTAALEKNTYRVSHMINADVSYQFNSSTRAHAGFHYLFAGRNVPEYVGINVDLRVEF